MHNLPFITVVDSLPRKSCHRYGSGSPNCDPRSHFVKNEKV